MILLLVRSRDEEEDFDLSQELEVGLKIESAIDGVKKDWIILFRDGYQTLPLDPCCKKKIVHSIQVNVDYQRVLARLDQKDELNESEEIQTGLPHGTFQILRLVDLPLNHLLKEMREIRSEKTRLNRIKDFIKKIVNRSKLPNDLKSQITDLDSIKRVRTRLMKETSSEAFILISLLKREELRQDEFVEKGLSRPLMDRMTEDDLKIISKCPGLFPFIILPMK